MNSTIKSVANSFVVLASFSVRLILDLVCNYGSYVYMGSYLSFSRSVMLTQFWLLCLYGVILKLLEKCNAHAILVLKGFWSREPSVLTKIKAAKFKKKRKEI